MKGLEKYSSIGDFLNNWLKIITILCAGIFGLLEYIEHKEDLKVERSLNYVERFNSSALTESRNTLSQIVDRESEKIIKTLSDNKLSAEEVQNKYNDLIVKMVSEHKMESQLRQQFDFHEEVVLCVTAGICDEFVVRSFFSTNAKQLFKAFYPYVCDQRKKWNNKSISENVEFFYISKNSQICL